MSFRIIHKPSGQPINYVKVVHNWDPFIEVPEEIVKGKHAKGHHVLIHPSELDELKLEAKHTIDISKIGDRAREVCDRAASPRNSTACIGSPR